MEAIVDTDDAVPAVEESEISSTSTSRPKLPKLTADGEDGSEASSPWSLTHDQQVHNLKENWKKAFHWASRLFVSRGEVSGDVFETNPWFERVVAKLRIDPFASSCELEFDDSFSRLFVPWWRISSLDLAVLMGDLKMVQKILKVNSLPDEVIRGSLVDRKTVLDNTVFILPGIEKTVILYTPLHLAVVGGDSDIVDVFLEKNVDVNALNWLKQTPLDLACETRNVDMLLKLLKEDRKERKDPLHVAVQRGDTDFIKKLPPLNVNAVDHLRRTPLHILASNRLLGFQVTYILKYLTQDKALDLKALDFHGLSAFYVAVLCCNTEVVIALLDSFKDQIRLNEVCDKERGPPIQIAFEGGAYFEDIQSALMECDPIKGYIDKLYRDRQVYVDAANAILVGAALIASVTFASWLQPPLNYTSYFGEGQSSSIPTPSTSDLNYVDVEYNIPMRAFWVFNALSFYFAIGTVVFGARSVLPRNHLFIKKTVEKLRTNLLVTSILLACSVLFVIIAFAIAGTIVLTPLLKYQWYMIVPTIVGGIVCIIGLVFLVKSIVENYSISNIQSDGVVLKQEDRDYLDYRGYYLDARGYLT